jgi:hypothetical protein
VGALICVRGCGYFDIEIARCFTTPNGHLRGLVRARHDCPRHHLIIIRLQSDNDRVKDFVLLGRVPSVIRHFTLTDSMAGEAGIVCATGAEVVVAISQFKKSRNRPILTVKPSP